MAEVQGPQAAAQRVLVVPERILPVVHQQLDALATQQYVLHGQVWPGQNIEWEIEDPDRDREGGGEESSADWNTTLRLTLPRLGGMEARLHLTPAGVALRLIADEAEAVEALEAARNRLDAALAAANVPLAGFVAERRDAAG
jgi:flagellar hook-length control protein FliK